MMPVPCTSFGKNGNGGAVAHNEPASKFIRRSCRDVSVALDQVPRLRERINNQARHHLWAEWLQGKLEGRDDAEIAAAAAQRPKQIRVVLLARFNPTTIGGDDVGGHEIVDGQTELAANPAKSTAEREAGNTCGRIDPSRRYQSEGLRLTVKFTKRHAGRHSRCAADGIDLNRFHQAQIEYHPAVIDRAAGNIVAAAAN